ncbi:hypothetical protein CRX72_19515 [Pantoea sp. BRM17]|nr:hypothetical protein CRX72_19515 [Pantoea sp. BRM17]
MAFGDVVIIMSPVHARSGRQIRCNQEISWKINLSWAFAVRQWLKSACSAWMTFMRFPVISPATPPVTQKS